MVLLEVFRGSRKIPKLPDAKDDRIAVPQNKPAARGIVCIHPFPKRGRFGCVPVLRQKEKPVLFRRKYLEARLLRMHQPTGCVEDLIWAPS
jgi:hypothetical protein